MPRPSSKPRPEFALSRRRIDVRVADERPEGSRAPHAAEADWWLTSPGGGLDDPGLAWARHTDRQHAATRAARTERAERYSQANADLWRAVCAYRVDHPTASVRSIAVALHRHYGRSGDRAKDVASVAQRIRRLDALAK
jgi:hypothetical protein